MIEKAFRGKIPLAIRRPTDGGRQALRSFSRSSGACR